MLLETRKFAYQRSANSHSLADLMDMYEQNYIRLRQLIPELDFADQMISCAAGHMDLYLTVKERCKYTSMISLSYRFEQQAGFIFEPDLHLKIYHDAKTAEVQHRLVRYRGVVQSAENLNQKWKMNRFLFKWLGFCLFQGHKFTPFVSSKVQTSRGI